VKKVAFAVLLFLVAALVVAQTSYTYNATAREQVTVQRVRTDRGLGTEQAAFNALVGPCLVSIVSDHDADDRRADCVAWLSLPAAARNGHCVAAGRPAGCRLGCP